MKLVMELVVELGGVGDDARGTDLQLVVAWVLTGIYTRTYDRPLEQELVDTVDDA